MMRMRFLRANAGLVWLGLCLFALAGVGGCGGSGGNSPSNTAPAAPAATDTTRAEGVVSISIPDLPYPDEAVSAATRLLPSKGAFLKVEVLDTIIEGGQSVQTAVPLYDAAGAQIVPGGATDRPLFDVIRQPNPTGQYHFLPLKSLLLRVGAYAKNPALAQNRDRNGNPPLSEAVVPFQPGRRNPDGSIPPSNTLAFTLDSTITRIAIEANASALEYAGDEALTLIPVAYVGEAIALRAATNLPSVNFDPNQITWAFQRIGSAIVVTPGANDPMETYRADFADPRPATLLRGSVGINGDVPSVVRATVRDEESGRTATRDFALRPKDGFANVTVSQPPFGTRSLVIDFDPLFNDTAPTQRLILDWRDGQTFTNRTNALPLVAGRTKVSVSAFSGDNGDGAFLGSVESPGDFTIPRGTATGLMLQMPPEDTNYTLFLVAGPNGAERTPVGAYTYRPFLAPTPLQNAVLIAGQTYLLEVRNSADGPPLPTNGFTAVPGQKMAISRVPDSTTRFELRLDSLNGADIANEMPAVVGHKPLVSAGPTIGGRAGIVLRETGAERKQRPITFAIAADLGGQGTVTVQ